MLDARGKSIVMKQKHNAEGTIPMEWGDSLLDMHFFGLLVREALGSETIECPVLICLLSQYSEDDFCERSGSSEKLVDPSNIPAWPFYLVSRTRQPDKSRSLDSTT